jgi:acyl carrier protein
MEIKEKIREILVNTIEGLNDKNLKDDEQLITTGYIDSYEIIKLMEAFENEFLVKIDIEKISLSDFETIEAMEKLILDMKGEAHE